MVDVAIDVSHVTKLYKLYANPSDRFKESLGLSKKKRYKELYALSDVSFNVKRGECVGIIGTNGSGKSTILKIITGVLSPTGGTVSVSGRISALLELGAGFNPEYTGLENIYVNGTVMGFSKEEVDARLDEIVNFADIGDFIRQPVKTYSSGMFVRLAFAVAINIDPEILIVDEALSVGDVFFQAKCYHKFEEFKREGKTILFVSHDLSSVAKYCDRVILLNKGVKKTEGGAKAVIDIYKQILVNTPIADDRSMIKENISRYLNTENAKGKWYSRLEVNPSVLDYGEKQAEIVEVAWNKDANGRWIMKEVEGTTELLDVDMILLSMGFTHPVRTGLLETLGVELDSRGNVKVNEWKMSSVKGVFAAGDVERGASLVVHAINAGRIAAAGVDAYLK